MRLLTISKFRQFLEVPLSPQVLGLTTVVSEDTERRALIAVDEVAGRRWMQTHLYASVWPSLSAPWMRDVDGDPGPSSLSDLARIDQAMINFLTQECIAKVFKCVRLI